MKFRSVFPWYSIERHRCEALAQGKPDPRPGSTNSEHLESMFSALSEGRQNPYGDVMLATKRRPRKIAEYPITARVAEAMVELFEIRKGES